MTELLEQELAGKRIKGRIGTGAMSDPYTFAERRYNLTGQALQLIARYGFGVHIITKSDLVLKDLGTLVQINRVQALVCFTLTTVDDQLARKIEPGAPLPSARLKAMLALSEAGIGVGVSLMPVLPFLEDNLDNSRAIVQSAATHGASYILPAFGMTLRDRQREYYYRQLDRLFPGLRKRYEQTFGECYSCPVREPGRLKAHFYELINTHRLATKAPPFQPAEGDRQLSLW